MARTRHRRAPAGGFGWPLAQESAPYRPEAGTEPAVCEVVWVANGRYREVAQRAPIDPRFLEVGVARLVEDDEIGVVGVHQDWGGGTRPCLVNPRPRKDSKLEGENVPGLRSLPPLSAVS